MRSTRAASAVVLTACLLALAGCRASPDPATPTSVWTPSGSPSAPAPGPTSAVAPAEPALPEAATEASERGARAFIEYYWALINYAQETGDVARLKALSASTCSGCSAGITGVRRLYRSGGRLQGGDYSITIVQIGQLHGRDPSHVAFEALVRVRNEEQHIVHPDGTQETQHAGAHRVAVLAFWLVDHWRLDAMELRR
ncbi:hypothetical protein GCM10022237_40200 [Nocardioides ginsengisoli]|uniref:DUF6318 family protein n=1 Tax=Nocardioides ginsengisoli TaxID=363868 RepID=A0ABW3W7V4_9ACTN